MMSVRPGHKLSLPLVLSAAIHLVILLSIPAYYGHVKLKVTPLELVQISELDFTEPRTAPQKKKKPPPKPEDRRISDLIRSRLEAYEPRLNERQEMAVDLPERILQVPKEPEIAIAPPPAPPLMVADVPLSRIDLQDLAPLSAPRDDVMPANPEVEVTEPELNVDVASLLKELPPAREEAIPVPPPPPLKLFQIQGLSGNRECTNEPLVGVPEGISGVVELLVKVRPDGSVGEIRPLSKSDQRLMDLVYSNLRSVRCTPLPPGAKKVTMEGRAVYRFETY